MMETDEQKPTTPIAVIGLGCRLPGGASSPARLWDLLKENRCGHGPVPPSRYNSEGFFHPDPERPGTIHSTSGYFIDGDTQAFENAFFGINNMEVRSMDAQQRKLLEVVFESFEDAGASLEALSGSNTGVYVGNFTNDHLIMQYQDPEYFTRYSATGSGPTLLSNRITHTFDLRGPSMTLDTACSSSLYALHLACQAIDAGDCDGAVVASANLIQSPEQQLIAVKAGILSPDAFCHTFDKSANGYGRAEGVVSIYLKKLDHAIRDGDSIRAVIKGTAVNGNGKTLGISQPSIEGQEQVIQSAYKRACLRPEETVYVEAHGTGTKVGDPIEVEAISRVFSKNLRPILIGGLKPSLGHSEGASGISSLLKVILSLENGMIPATINVTEINPSIEYKKWNVEIAKENINWPTNAALRASLNSFGFGGANSHAIIEAASPTTQSRTKVNGTADHQATGYTVSTSNKSYDQYSDRAPPFSGHGTPGTEISVSQISESKESLVLLILSAKSVVSLEQNAAALSTWVASHANAFSIADLEYTLNRRRSPFPYRTFALQSTVSISSGLGFIEAPVPMFSNDTEKLIDFVFTGQGAQWRGMAKELMSQYNVFRDSIKRLSCCLEQLPEDLAAPWNLNNVILSEDEVDSIDVADVAQTLCTAIQVALVDLLHDWNICPKMVVGHSSGEIAAAYAAGFLTAEQAILAAYARGHVVSKISKLGAMAVVGMGEEDTHKLIREYNMEPAVTVACKNSPETTTISGDAAEVESIQERLKGRNIFARLLKTGGRAYHSYHMKDIGSLYESLLVRLWSSSKISKSATRSSTRPSMISTVTGDVITGAKAIKPSYWRINLESPVRFQTAVTKMFSKHCSRHFLEIGPHAALELPIHQIAASLAFSRDQYVYQPTLIRQKHAVHTMLALCGTLFQHGYDAIRFENISTIAQSLPRAPRLLHNLPPYSWDYTEITRSIEPRIVKEFRNRRYPRHDLLGSQIPGGSRPTIAWRNILNVHEISWLKDHCLGPSIVFPAAGYIAIATEAICQANHISLQECPGVDLRRLNFLKALDLHAEEKLQIEIVTELRPRQISSTLVSDRWWELAISTIHEDSQETLHMTAAVALMSLPTILPRTIHLDRSDMELQRPNIWYDKFTDEGLRWGPQFAVMDAIYTDRSRHDHQAAASTRLRRGDQRPLTGGYQYVAHPASIDGMLQTAFVATTAGWVRELRATVPVSMERVQISAPALLEGGDIPWFYDSMSKKTGFGTVNIDAELYDDSERVLIRMSEVRCVPYQGKSQDTRGTQLRKPLARVLWKPDITKCFADSGTGLLEYVNWYARDLALQQRSVDPVHDRLAACLDLVVHKQPRSSVIYVGLSNEFAALCEQVLRIQSPLRRCSSFTVATLDPSGQLLPSEDHDDYPFRRELSADRTFDVVIVDLVTKVADIKPLFAPRTTVVCTNSCPESLDGAKWQKVLKNHEHVSPTMAVACFQKDDPVMNGFKAFPTIIINATGEVTTFEACVQRELESVLGISIPVIGLDRVFEDTIPPQSTVISTIEAEKPLLLNVQEDKLAAIQRITDAASKIMWLTNNEVLLGKNPNSALVSGLSRAVMLEQPSLQFCTLAVDDLLRDPEKTALNVRIILDDMKSERMPDMEYVETRGTLHVSRWEPEERLNEEFVLKQNQITTESSLEAAGATRLGIRQPGQFDSVHFVKDDLKTLLPSTHVEVQVKCVGMNAKDLYVLGGKIDTKDVTCSCECAGIITAVGEEVLDLHVGDRVVCMAPGHFGTYERVPHWAVMKLQENETFADMCTIPIVYSTAIYALRHKADLQPDETLLIHSAAGGLGIAAIQVAREIGAEIFCTVGNEAKKKFLGENFGIPGDHIFTSRDSSFLSSLLTKTSGRGVDVVLNSLTGELLHSSLEACSNFGRFVEVGKRDIIDHGNMDMNIFKRNISFIAFDLADIFQSSKPSHFRLWKQLLEQSLAFVRSDKAQGTVPTKVFDVSKIAQAFKYFALGTRIGKVVVSMEDPRNIINVIPSRYVTTFNPRKTYLMVGCLGGLGRSMTKWMMTRGARNFVFLGRSGTTKPIAQALVKDLITSGADVKVVQGDVGTLADVETAVAAAALPIGGVVQAAMGLSEALWTAMSHNNWHTSIRPKVHGTWNLHNALLTDRRGDHLDFFLLTSSISGTVGTATESNYCSANAFLDAFARYRNSLGLPAVSVGLGMISEVGYLHEHPEIERLLKRKGIHSINEDELLQIIDLALANQHPSTWQRSYDKLSNNHLLTGIEFIGLKQQRDLGFDGDNHVLADPRASLFAAAFERSTANSTQGAISSSHELPKEIQDALQAQSNITLAEAVTAIVKKKIANLILLPEEKLQPEKRLGEFGLDSMLAAEFRTFVYHALEVDVPFMTLLDKTTSVSSLAALITEQMEVKSVESS